MPGCDVTRRDLLRWAAVALASPVALRSDLLTGVASASTTTNDVSPVNLELVTLAEDHAVITWYTGYTGTDDGLGRMQPAPADAQVRWGTHPHRLRHIAGSRWRNTPYHHVELTDLEPGQTYYYQAWSNGKLALPTPFTLITGNAVGTSTYGLTSGGPYSFTTPQPPPGRFIFSVALCNDLHLGETVAGRSGSIPALVGIEQLPGRPPYPEVMLESLVRDARVAGADYLLAAGDISAEAVPVDLSMAGRLLRRFGTYQRDYFVVRGNHDRAHTGDAWAACSVGQWGGNDCFHDQFFPDEPTYFRRDLQGLRVIGIDTYDRPGRGSEPGLLSPDQLAWLRTELADEPDQPTIVFGHHPLLVQDSVFPMSPSSALDAAQAQTILQDYARNPGVFLHHAGHTHRNKRTTSPVAPAVLHQEVAAVKEYPGGFSLLRLHTGGYAVNFYKTRSELSREWSERSRQQVLGFWPQFALGAAVSDRNTMIERDLSGLHRGHGGGRGRGQDRGGSHAGRST